MSRDLNMLEDSERRFTIMFRAVAAGIWLLATAIYLVVSGITKAWEITWVAFPIALILHNIVYRIMRKRYIDA